MEEVEWGEYKIDDLFEVVSYKKRFDANKVDILKSGKFPYVVRMNSNNGQRGFINEDETFLNDANTISFGQDTATMFYQDVPYFTGDKIKILKAKDERFSKNNAQFFLTIMTKAFSSFSWGSSSFSVDTIKNQKITLPISKGGIDFEFMENLISELEAIRISELEAYLLVTGLNNYILTDEEKQLICDFKHGKITFEKIKYEDIFNKIIQGRRLKKDDQISGNIPFVMAGITNTGVANYISNPVSIFPRNSITIDIFGNTFYRDYAFGAGDDTGVYWNDEKEYSKELMLFFATAMGKSIGGKFSYGKKLRSSQSLKFGVTLPIKDNKPDYEAMKTLISAVQKLIIKDVVLYTDRKIATTKDIVTKKADL